MRQTSERILPFASTNYCPACDSKLASAESVPPKKARQEQAVCLEKAKLVPKEEVLGNNSMENIFAIVTPMVEGEVLVREGKLNAGVEQLRTAIKTEDALVYDEPPGWLIPVQHSLGATFMQHGRFAEAEQVYRDDLRKLPDNGWSLYGLAESLAAQEKDAPEAKAAKAKFQKLWAKADMKITSSCLCQPGKMKQD